MKDAFKVKAKIAARGAAIEAARALIRPTLLRQPVLAKVFNSLPPAVRAEARISISAVKTLRGTSLAPRPSATKRCSDGVRTVRTDAPERGECQRSPTGS